MLLSACFQKLDRSTDADCYSHIDFPKPIDFYIKNPFNLWPKEASQRPFYYLLNKLTVKIFIK